MESPSRAYIAFKNEEILATFNREYDGHIFEDKAGKWFTPYELIIPDATVYRQWIAGNRWICAVPEDTYRTWEGQCKEQGMLCLFLHTVSVTLRIRWWRLHILPRIFEGTGKGRTPLSRLSVCSSSSYVYNKLGINALSFVDLDLLCTVTMRYRFSTGLGWVWGVMFTSSPMQFLVDSGEIYYKLGL